MADLSKLELTNSTIVTLKDNSQALSDHRHHDSDLVPIVHKTYESTSYYGTANDWENTSWYFMSVRPDAWYKPWRVKFKVHSYCPNYASYESYTYATLCGREASTIYANWNERYSSAHSYITVYPLKKAGFDAGYGHAVAVSIYNADSRTSSAYYRTFEIDYYECENCTVTILDTPVKWSAWTGTGTTNYNSIVANNAIDRGLQETGDANSSAYIPRPYYTNVTAGGNGIKQYSLFARLPDGTYSSFTTDAGTGTKTFDTTTVFDFSRIYYRSASSNLAVGSKCGNDQFWPAYQLNNMQYSFNGVTTSDATSSLTKQKHLYLVVSHDWKLVSPYYTQDPTASTSVYYILLGFMYDCYRLDLWDDNPIYEYDGTSFKQIIPADALTVNGHTIESDVPSNAEFTDTTYTFTGGTNGFTVTPEGGSAQTVTVTPSIANNITGSGTSGYLTKFNGTNTVTNGPQLGSDTTKFLRNDGTWQVPSTGTDENVAQTATTTSSDYEVLFSGTADNTTRTEGARKNSNLKFNPSTGNLQATQLNGVTIGSSPKFTDNNTTYSLTQDSTDGHKITLTPSSGTAQTVTIPDNNTTYTFANGTNGFTVTPSGGSAQTVTVTPSITNNVTGSGTSGYIAKFNGTNTITNGPQFGSTTTTYLNNAGSWATPPDTKNTAGSTDTSSKIYLIGATSQAANPQTYSDNEVYATSGVVTTKSVQIGGGSATMQYNSTTQAIDFVFT